MRWKLAIDQCIGEKGYSLDILVAFKAYNANTELVEASDLHPIPNLKTKLHSQGQYDEWAICRVVKVLLGFECEINTVDLSKVVLTHHHLHNLGIKKRNLTQGDSLPIPGMAPGGDVQDKGKAELAEIITNDNLPQACSVFCGRMMESTNLQLHALANG